MQNYWGVGGWRSSTYAEGVLRGQGARAYGYGKFLESLGRYQNLHQDAVQKALQNRKSSIHQYWEMKKFYNEARMQQEEAAQQILARKRKLRIESELAKQQDLEVMRALDANRRKLDGNPKQRFVIDGRDYGSYENFKKSDAYLRYIAKAKWEVLLDDARQHFEQQKLDEALKFLSKRSVLTPGEQWKLEQQAIINRRLSVGY